MPRQKCSVSLSKPESRRPGTVFDSQVQTDRKDSNSCFFPQGEAKEMKKKMQKTPQIYCPNLGEVSLYFTSAITIGLQLSVTLHTGFILHLQIGLNSNPYLVPRPLSQRRPPPVSLHFLSHTLLTIGFSSMLSG